MDPDQDRHSVGPDLGPNCLQSYQQMTKVTASMESVKTEMSPITTTSNVFSLVYCFTSLSTAMVMAGRSVHLTAFFLGKLEQAVNQYFLHILLLVTDNNPS